MEPLTHQFLRLIGSPFAVASDEFDIGSSSKLYRYAIKNRMRLTCLEALEKRGRLSPFQKEYAQLLERYAETQVAIRRVSSVLDRADVDYVLFKSIRPYKEVTVDIDILIFDSKHEEVVRDLRHAGYTFLGKGPLSTTLRDKEACINMDIYDEVGVSRIIYLDKDTMKEYVGARTLEDNTVVRTLNPEADLLAVIAHSLIKEQMYVLSEYYTTLHYLADMKDERLDSFLLLTGKCRMRSAVKTHLGITAFLHKSVHGFVPACLMELSNELGIDSLELMRIKKMGFQMPSKFHPITLFRAFAEKFGEEKARRSFASQTLSMLDLDFTSQVIKRMIQHISRETY